jgi:hypothetical protein
MRPSDKKPSATAGGFCMPGGPAKWSGVSFYRKNGEFAIIPKKLKKDCIYHFRKIENLEEKKWTFLRKWSIIV